jgi:hypothetical protein
MLIPALALAQEAPVVDAEAEPAPVVTSSGFTERSVAPIPEPPPEDPNAEDSIGGWEAAAPDEELTEESQQGPLPDDTPSDEEAPVNWVDDSHAYATNQAQALTEWMDNFFGDPNYDLEKAESLLRLEFVSDWDEEDGNDFKVRLRGKVQLPRISRRLNLVFAGEDGNELDEEERREEDTIGLNYEIRENQKGRLDATIGFASGNIRPGVRYRRQGNLSDTSTYRFTQRVQYEDGEGFYSTTQQENNWAFDEDSVLRWSNRVKWGEHTDGAEWRTKLALRERYNLDTKRPMAISYYGTIKGITRPDSFVKNYRVGAVVRRQVYRDFLFIELEPGLNYRRRDLEYDRDFAWSMVIRLEIALERDLRRLRNRNNDVEG